LSGLLDGSHGRELAVLMVDVDHFKSVNDRFGHAAGDRALRVVAETLRGNTRVFDSIARYGGEEFVVLMPGTGPDAAVAAAERLRASVAAAAFDTPDGSPVHLTVSVGVACSPEHPASPDALLAAADQALYDAKRGGRNRVTVALAPLAGAGSPAL
jgi:two-component system cell cycle response regulator